jgi:regulator of replication initiation timing
MIDKPSAWEPDTLTKYLVHASKTLRRVHDYSDAGADLLQGCPYCMAIKGLEDATADLARVRAAMHEWEDVAHQAKQENESLRHDIKQAVKAAGVEATRAEAAEQAREAAEKDKERLDLLDSKWMDGIHVEVYGKRRGEHWADARREATVYLGSKEFKGDTVRAAIDAAGSQGK